METLLSRRHAIGLTLAGAAGLSMPALAEESDVAGNIDRLARDLVNAGRSPGLQVAVQKNDRQLLLGSYGVSNLEFGTPVRKDTPFRIASLTKQFTAVALLRLQEEGRLSLNDTLDKYYPRFPRASEVTISRMINHTSGIHNYLKRPDWLADVMIRRDADASADYYACMPRVYDFDPGTGWEYSNSAYIMLGGVIEKASGQSFSEALRTRIFAPLRMQNTAVDDELAIIRGRASGYDERDGGGFDNTGFLSVLATGAAGSMRSTAADLVKWKRGLFSGKILNSASLKAMLEPARLANGNYASTNPEKRGSSRLGYGYGVGISETRGQLKVSHTGGIHGFRSLMSHYPDTDVTVVILSNCAAKDTSIRELSRHIEALVI